MIDGLESPLKVLDHVEEEQLVMQLMDGDLK